MPDANITKSALAKSMKKLMKEKPFSKISVIDICNGCGMNRKSFYYHFKDKYDLVNWIFYTDFIMLISRETYSNGWDLLVGVGELFYQDQDFYRAAFRIEGQNSFREYFFESLRPIMSFFVMNIFSEEEEAENILNTVCNVYMSIMIGWLEDGCRQDPETFIRQLQMIVLKLADNSRRNAE